MDRVEKIETSPLKPKSGLRGPLAGLAKGSVSGCRPWKKDCRASLDRTAEGGCPYMGISETEATCLPKKLLDRGSFCDYIYVFQRTFGSSWAGIFEVSAPWGA